MFVKKEITIDDMSDFLWGEARKRWLEASDDQREAVWDLLDAVFGNEIPDETAINDFVWNDCDDVFSNEEYESLKHCKSKQSKLESRIKRLEYALRKNEGVGYRLKQGDAVEDVDNYTGTVVGVGRCGDLFKKFRAHLCDANVESLMELMSEDPNWASIGYCVVVRYDDPSDMDGGDCALWTDPENGLELI